MVRVVPLRFGTMFKKAFSDSEVFSGFASDVLGLPIHVDVVQQEYRYPDAIGPVKVTYDLFAEDVEHRIIVEIQHIRENDFFDRFLHYHVVGIVEQATSHDNYRTARTVCTVVVLTSDPRDSRLDFSLAVTDLDPVNERGQRLGVYKHRLVFLNPKRIREETPAAARRWMALIADSLDGQMEEDHYPDPLMKRVIRAIRNDAISPDELALVKDEAAWEEVKRDARLEGKLEATRAMLVQLAGAAGLALGESDLARIDACKEEATLQRWILRVSGARQAASLFEPPGDSGPEGSG